MNDNFDSSNFESISAETSDIPDIDTSEILNLAESEGIGADAQDKSKPWRIWIEGNLAHDSSQQP